MADGLSKLRGQLHLTAQGLELPEREKSQPAAPRDRYFATGTGTGAASALEGGLGPLGEATRQMGAGTAVPTSSCRKHTQIPAPAAPRASPAPGESWGKPALQE